MHQCFVDARQDRLVPCVGDRCMISPTSNREYLEFTNPVEYTDAFEDSKVSRTWSVTTLLFGISIVFSRKKEVSSVGTNSARGIMSPDHMANLGQAKFQNTIFIIHYITLQIAVHQVLAGPCRRSAPEQRNSLGPW